MVCLFPGADFASAFLTGVRNTEPPRFGLDVDLGFATIGRWQERVGKGTFRPPSRLLKPLPGERTWFAIKQTHRFLTGRSFYFFLLGFFAPCLRRFFAIAFPFPLDRLTTAFADRMAAPSLSPRLSWAFATCANWRFCLAVRAFLVKRRASSAVQGIGLPQSQKELALRKSKGNTIKRILILRSDSQWFADEVR
jgi:hypothetical protein